MAHPTSSKSTDSPQPTRLPGWVYGLTLFGVLIMAVGAAISKFDPTLLSNGQPIPAGVRIYTDYMFSRSLAVAVLVAVALVGKSRRVLAALLCLCTLIQTIDAIDDALRGDMLLAPGVLVLAAIFLLAARGALGRPLFKWRSWTD